MLYIMDVDGTIAMSYSDELLPEAAKFFAGFDWEKDKLALATNQGGVGLRYWMEQGGFGEPEEKPTAEQVQARLEKLRSQIVGKQIERCPIFVSFAYQSKKSGKWAPTPYDLSGRDLIATATSDDPMVKHIPVIPNEWREDWRKPAPGMLLAAMKHFGETPENTVMIGNSDDDKGAAAAAGVRFIDEFEFFKPHYTFTYRPAILTDWLQDNELVGLDIEATKARFRHQINKSLNGASEHRDVTTFVEDDDLELGYVIEPDEEGRHERWIYGTLFVDRDWLVYESAEAHAAAMANALHQVTVNHAVVLPVILSSVYGISGKEAYALVEKYKDKDAWDRTRFYLGAAA
jgi:phosphoglycolate phosphatase-like HAD superfamily hydrolase